jgi:pre-mRNA-splicing helicase BRR2
MLCSLSSLSEAMQWLGYTYFFVRILRRRAMYGASADDAEQDPSFLRAHSLFAHAVITHQLEKHRLVKYYRRVGNVLSTYVSRQDRQLLPHHLRHHGLI